MLFRYSYAWFFLVAMGIAFYFSACQDDLTEQPYTKMGPAYENYLKGYTTGVISRSTKVKLIFAEDQIEANKIGSSIARPFVELSPELQGEWQWISKRAVAFFPEEVLPADASYTAKLHLDMLYPDIDAKLRSFSFNFRTRALQYSVDLEELETPDYNDWGKLALSGQLRTNDYASPKAVEQMLAIEQGANPDLEVEWEHSDNQRVHRFFIKGLKRGARDEKLLLSWKGSAIGVDEQKEQELQIAARNKFELLRISAHQENQSPYLRLQFSDPLLPNQDLEGLILVKQYANQEAAYSYDIRGSQVILYLPDGRLKRVYDVEVSGALRNFHGKRLGLIAERKVELEDLLKPQVEMVNSGVVLPSEGDFIFPFSAIGLEAVEIEVFRIQDDNILQFLQENSLGGDKNLYRVGEIVHQQKLDLRALHPDADFTSWRRYAVKLNAFIKQEPGALYQVRLAFKPEFALLNCNDLDLAAFKQVGERPYQPNEQGAYQSILNSNTGYWQVGEDPCSRNYYGREHFLAQNILGSNLGVTVKKGNAGKMLVAVNNLLSSKPESGVTIKIYNFSQRLLKELKTDKQGFCTLGELEDIPRFLVAEKGEQRAYLRLQSSSELPMSRFDVEGMRSEEGLKGKLYAERGVWRPGDSIYLTFVLEDKRAKLPEMYPINFRLYDPNSNLVEERRTAEQMNKVYPLRLATQPSSPTGTWRAEVTAGGQTFSKNLRIETIRPNRLKIDLEVNRFRLNEGVLAADAQVRWLQGAMAANKRFKLVGRFSALRTSFEDYPAYVFDDPARSVSDEPFVLFDQQLDENGAAQIEADLERAFQAPGLLKLSLSARAFEQGGNYSINNISVPYYPFDRFVGLKTPDLKGGMSFLAQSEKGQFDFVVVGADGKAVSGKQQLNIGVYKMSSRWWIESNEAEVTNFNSTVHLGAIQVDELTTDGNGQARWEYQPKSKGKFLIRACDEESGHCSGTYFYVGESWRSSRTDSRMAATALNVELDKQRYDVGEEVRVQIPSAAEGHALVSIENGHKILEHFWVKTQARQTAFTFKTDASMSPNAYVHVSLLQPHRQTENDLPIRLYGVVPLEVVNPATQLQPQINMAELLQPEQPVKIKVSEATGRPMTYTLAVVDEGLLDITNYKTPELRSHFYRKEALGVRTWDMYNEVIGTYAGKLEHIFSIGGGMNRQASDSKFNRFKPVVKYFGPFELKAGATATHSFEMPKYVGSVRTMLVASHKGAYGSAEETTPVRSPVMVLGTLPRQLAPGDRLQLPVATFAMESDIKTVDVRVQAYGAAKVVGNGQKSLRFERPTDKMLYFDIQAKDKEGIARFNITATGGGHSASYEVELRVENPNTAATRASHSKVAAGGNWETDFKTFGAGTSHSVQIEVSSIPPLNLSQRLAFLKGYPHGCIEQTVSKGFPQMLAARLLKLSKQEQKEVDEYVQASIDRVRDMQLSDGGFGYWPNAKYASEWGSSYAGHFLLEAKALGYRVSKFSLSKWLNFQKAQARSWSYGKNRGSTYRNGALMLQSYRLYTLALAGTPALAEMNNLREVLRVDPAAPAAATWRLAAAYGLMGKAEVGEQLVKDAKGRAEHYPTESSIFASKLRDDAMILEAMLYLNKKEEAAQIATRISEELRSDEWMSTQTTGFALVAMAKMAEKAYQAADFSFSYQLGNAETTQASIQKGYFFRETIPYALAKSEKLRFNNSSNQPLYVRIVSKGRPAAIVQPGFERKVKLQLSYMGLDQKPLDATKLPQGSDFVAKVSLENTDKFQAFSHMALSQIFPAGWEIINVRLAEAFEGVARASADSYDYQDIRDDRVLTYFSLEPGAKKSYYVVLNASYEGRFYKPSTYAEEMYDNSISAATASAFVEVVGAAKPE